MIVYFLVKVLSKKKVNFTLQLATIIFFIYPASLFIINYPKLSILKHDFTSEKLGDDVLSTVPNKSILILSFDTVLFNVQYEYYIQRKWPDIKLIHHSKLYSSYYFSQLAKYYPDLSLPKQDEDKKRLFIDFLDRN